MIRERGAAVVLAMLIAALAAAVAATVFADQQRWSRSVEHRRDQVQAQALAIAGVQWARQILDDDARRSDARSSRRAVGVAGCRRSRSRTARSAATIVDAQGRLNVNPLGSAGAAAQRERTRIAALFAQRGRTPSPRWTRSPTGSTPTALRAKPAPRTPSTWATDARARGERARPSRRRPRRREGRDAADARRRRAVPFGVAGRHPAQRQHRAPRGARSGRRQPHRGAQRGARRRPGRRRPTLPSPSFARGCRTAPRLRATRGSPSGAAYFYVAIEAKQGATLARARALLRRNAGAWPDPSCGRSSSDGTTPRRRVNYDDAGADRSLSHEDVARPARRAAVAGSRRRVGTLRRRRHLRAHGRRPPRQPGPRRTDWRSSWQRRSCASRARRCRRCRPSRVAERRGFRARGPAGGTAGGAPSSPPRGRRPMAASASSLVARALITAIAGSRREDRPHRRRARPRPHPRGLAMVRRPTTVDSSAVPTAARSPSTRLPRDGTLPPSSRSRSCRPAREGGAARTRSRRRGLRRRRSLARWQRETGVVFRAAASSVALHAPRRAAFADRHRPAAAPAAESAVSGRQPAAPVRTGTGARRRRARRSTLRRPSGEWASLRLDAWREAREWTDARRGRRRQGGRRDDADGGAGGDRPPVRRAAAHAGASGARRRAAAPRARRPGARRLPPVIGEERDLQGRALDTRRAAGRTRDGDPAISTRSCARPPCRCSSRRQAAGHGCGSEARDGRVACSPLRIPDPALRWLAAKSRSERRVMSALLAVVLVALAWASASGSRSRATWRRCALRGPATRRRHGRRAPDDRRDRGAGPHATQGGSCRCACRRRAHACAAEPAGRCDAARGAGRTCPRRVCCSRLRRIGSSPWKPCNAKPACAPWRRR